MHGPEPPTGSITEILAVAGNTRVPPEVPGAELDTPLPGTYDGTRLRVSGRSRGAVCLLCGGEVLGRAVPDPGGGFGFSVAVPDPGLTVLRLCAGDQARVPLSLVYCRRGGPAAPVPDPVPADGPLAMAVGGLLRKWNLPGAVLVSESDDGVRTETAYGFADSAAHRPMTPGARFRIGSLSKLPTAVACHRLVAQGVLDPHRPVSELLGVESPVLDGIAPVHLLCNRSGLELDIDPTPALGMPGFDPVTKTERTDGAAPVPPSLVEQVLRDAGKTDPPGERFRYVTANYWLLGRVVEACTGTGYAAHVRADILEPLGLGSVRLGTSFPDTRTEGEVTYHGGADPVSPPAAVLGLSGRVPAAYAAALPLRDAMGGWVMTAGELAHLARHVLNGDSALLGPDGAATFLGRPPFPHGRTDWYYAQGAFVSPPPGFDPSSARDYIPVTWWHFGGVDGACGVVGRVPGRVVALLINGTPLDRDIFLATLWRTIVKAAGREGRP